MFGVSVGSYAPLLGCGLMMLVCMGPMLSARVRGWFQRGDGAEPVQSGTGDEVAALRAEIAQLRSQIADSSAKRRDEVGR